jgi:hypothetical protein
VGPPACVPRVRISTAVNSTLGQPDSSVAATPTLLLVNLIVTCHGPRTNYNKPTTTKSSCSCACHAAWAQEAVGNVLGFVRFMVQCLTVSELTTSWWRSTDGWYWLSIGFLLGDRSAGTAILACALAQIAADTTLHSSRRCSCKLFDLSVHAQAICSRLCEGCMQHAAH